MTRSSPTTCRPTLSDRPFFRNETGRLTEVGAQAGGALRHGTLGLWGRVSRNALRQQSFTQHDETLRVTTWRPRCLARPRGHPEPAGPAQREGPRGSRHRASPRTRGALAPVGSQPRRRAFGTALVVGRRDARAPVVPGRRVPAGCGGRPGRQRARGLQGSAPAARTTRSTRAAPACKHSSRPAARAARSGFDHSVLAGLGYRRSRVGTTPGLARRPGPGAGAAERVLPRVRAHGVRAADARPGSRAACTTMPRPTCRTTCGAADGAWRSACALDRQAGRNLASSVDANPVLPELLPAVVVRGHAVAVQLAGRAAARGRVVRPGIARPGASRVPRTRRTAPSWARATSRSTTRSGARPRPSPTTGSTGTAITPCSRTSWTCSGAGWAASGIDPRDPAVDGEPARGRPRLSRRPARTSSRARWRGTWPSGVRATLRASWRRHVDPRCAPLRGLTMSDYVIRGAVQGTLFGRRRTASATSRRPPSRGSCPATGVCSPTARATGRSRGRWRSSCAGAPARTSAGPPGRPTSTGASTSRTARSRSRTPRRSKPSPLQDAGRVVVRAGRARPRRPVRARALERRRDRAMRACRCGFTSALVLTARDGFPIPYFQVANSGDPTAGSQERARRSGRRHLSPAGRGPARRATGAQLRAGPGHAHRRRRRLQPARTAGPPCRSRATSSCPCSAGRAS